MKNTCRTSMNFTTLGIGDPIPISSSAKLGLGDMLDEVVKYFRVDELDEEEDEIPKIAIVGKPNVGKSSIINRLLGQNRVIVSDVAGTTRDAIDTNVMWNGREYTFIDTRRTAPEKQNQRGAGAVPASSVPSARWSGPMWSLWSSMRWRASPSRMPRSPELPTREKGNHHRGQQMGRGGENRQNHLQIHGKGPGDSVLYALC